MMTPSSPKQKKITFKEKDMPQIVRLSAKIPRIDLNVLCQHLDGDFSDSECPNKFIAIWRGHKIIFTRNEIRTFMPLTTWEKIKEDFHKFINEDLEWPKFKKEIRLK